MAAPKALLKNLWVNERCKFGKTLVCHAFCAAALAASIRAPIPPKGGAFSSFFFFLFSFFFLGGF